MHLCDLFLEQPFTKIRNGLNENGTFHFYMLHSEILNSMKFTKDDIFHKHSIKDVINTLEMVGFSKITYEYNNGYYVKCDK